MSQISSSSKAFILQKLEELKPLLTKEETATVTEADAQKKLKVMKKKGEDVEAFENSTHCLIITIANKDSEMQIEGFGNSHEEAMIQASTAAFSILNQVHNDTVSSEHVNNMIEKVRTKGHIIH